MSYTLALARCVDQTAFESQGNCFAACVATVLGLRLEDVPAFEHPIVQVRDLSRWLADKGLALVCARAGSGYMGECLHMRLGSGPRGRRHAVVYYGGSLVHDPHPSRAGLLEGEPQTALFFVPIDVGVHDGARG